MMDDKVSAANPKNIPMTETDYYQWLLSNGVTNIHAVFTKKTYLNERFGFILKVDTINVDNLQTLKYIESFYFDSEVMKKGIA